MGERSCFVLFALFLTFQSFVGKFVFDHQAFIHIRKAINFFLWRVFPFNENSSSLDFYFFSQIYFPSPYFFAPYACYL